MDLIGIRTFCRTVETGNLTAAARELHITKSVVSRRIQMLEEDLGVRLLVRTTRGVTPTDAGTQFYERAISILNDIEDARQAVKSSSENLIGLIRVTAPRSYADIGLHDPLLSFMSQYPGLSFELHLSDERVDVIGGGYDLALRIAKNMEDTSLIAKKLTTIQQQVVASPAYLEKYGVPDTPADLKDHNCVFYANVAASEQWQFIGPEGSRKAVRVGGTVTTNSGSMQLAIVRAGLAIATLPDFFLKDALESGDIVPILTDWTQPESALYTLYPERRLLPTKVRTLIDFLSDWFTQPREG